MTFTVEDGTGVVGANSYTSVEFADTYLENSLSRQVWQGLGLDSKERLLVAATRWLDANATWRGLPTAAVPSVLRWPRSGVMDRDNLPIADDTIPYQLQAAVCELAVFQANPENNPSTFGDTYGISELTVDVITIKFQDGFNSQARKYLPGLVGMLVGIGYVRSANGPKFGVINKT